LRWLISRLDILRQASAAELALGFVLGTFHTCVLVFVAVTVLFLAGDLGDQLEELSTLLGIGLFLVLWLTTCYFTLCAWLELRVGGLRSGSMGSMLVTGIKWGGIDGMCVAFLVAIVEFLVVAILGFADGAPFAFVIGFVIAFFVAFLGGAIGLAIGGTLGLVAALLEAPIILAARAVAGVPPRAGQQDAPAE
jgi:hypothetical protein